MTGLHLLGLFLDGYIDYGFTELLVPGASAYRPLAVAIGILSFYVLVAIQATSYMRRRLSKRVWRAIHLLSYGLVWSAAIHAGTAGTDSVNRVYQVLALLLTMIAVAATVLRIVTPGRSERATACRSHPGVVRALAQSPWPASGCERAASVRWSSSGHIACQAGDLHIVGWLP